MGCDFLRPVVSLSLFLDNGGSFGAVSQAGKGGYPPSPEAKTSDAAASFVPSLISLDPPIFLSWSFGPPTLPPTPCPLSKKDSVVLRFEISETPRRETPPSGFVQRGGILRVRSNNVKRRQRGLVFYKIRSCTTITIPIMIDRCTTIY